MNALRKRWQSGIAGKLIIVAGVVFGCAVCGLAASLMPDSGQEGGTGASASPAPATAVSALATRPSAAEATPAPAATVAPTATPMPTDTPAPTATAAPTATPAPTLAPEEALRAAVVTALNDGNRGVDRVRDVILLDDGSVSIGWAINDNLTKGFVLGGARGDVVDILRAVRDTGLPVTGVNLAGTFSMVDVYGNTSESIVVSASYGADTLAKLNLDNVLLQKTIYEAADSIKVHPEFQGE